MNLFRRGFVPTLTGPRLLGKIMVLVVILLLVGYLSLLLTFARHSRTSAALDEHTFTTPYDTINGEHLTDQDLTERIEHIAAGVPAHLLAAHPRDARIRYVAQAFGAGDDAPIFQGIFRDPAAALAFGCAVDEDLSNRCSITPPAEVSTMFEEEVPGVHCEPMRLALGAPAYEPDRCQAE